jgi:hypothetical protein
MVSPEDGKGKGRKPICQIRKRIFRRQEMADFLSQKRAIMLANGENIFNRWFNFNVLTPQLLTIFTEKQVNSEEC